MLNELLVIARGAREAGVEMASRHPDIKDAGKKPTVRVRLDEGGDVSSIDPIPRDFTLWTLGKGNKKRFPFMQPNAPLLRMPSEMNIADELTQLVKLKGSDRRARLLSLCRASSFNEKALDEWPGVRDRNGGWSQEPKDYLNALRLRRQQLSKLSGTAGESILAALDRFLVACETSEHGGAKLLRQIANNLIASLEMSPSDEWLRIAEPLLLQGGGALYFDVPSADFHHLVGDPRQVLELTKVLQRVGGEETNGKCALTGRMTQLVEDTFPELVVPVINKTILFSRFNAIPANDRYGRFGADSFPVAQQVVDDLAAALRALTSESKKGITWRSIPGEKPKQYDLLLSFVETMPDAAFAGELADNDSEEDLSQETSPALQAAGSVAAFEKRTKRLIDAVRAKIQGDFRETPVRLAVLRKVDPANRKVIYSGEIPMREYFRAATDWIAGEKNVPALFTLPVLRKGEAKPRRMSPPHVSPLGVIAFTKQYYVRGGAERQDVVGLPATEAIALFLERDRSRASRVLRMVIARRVSLLSGTAHALRRGMDSLKNFDRHEALRTVTILSILLEKLGRKVEVYMADAAFKLGQLLAAADVVHAGYCADVRGGDVPSSLLGNQVFAMAQTAPTKALAVLCRRWKPYGGWAKKMSRDVKRLSSIRQRKEKPQGDWDILTALRHAREMQPLADELGPLLLECGPFDDAFRAELLLGYLAGLQKPAPDSETGDDPQASNERQES